MPKTQISDINPGAFQRIIDGTKTVEFRINDNIWSKVNIRDEIIFTKLPDNTEKLKVKVLDLYHGKDFGELYDLLGTGYFGDRPKDEFAKSMGNFYTEKQVRESGALGLRIKYLGKIK